MIIYIYILKKLTLCFRRETFCVAVLFAEPTDRRVENYVRQAFRFYKKVILGCFMSIIKR